MLDGRVCSEFKDRAGARNARRSRSPLVASSVGTATRVTKILSLIRRVEIGLTVFHEWFLRIEIRFASPILRRGIDRPGFSTRKTRIVGRVTFFSLISSWSVLRSRLRLRKNFRGGFEPEFALRCRKLSRRTRSEVTAGRRVARDIDEAGREGTKRNSIAPRSRK